MKWSFQTPSLYHFSPTETDSGIWAVLPSAATNEPGPKSVASASGLLSAYCMSKPHWTTLFASNDDDVASFPFLSTVSFMPSSRSAAMSHGLPWYVSPTFVGGDGRGPPARRFFFLYMKDR